MSIPVIFLDKDGTLSEDFPPNIDVSKIRLMKDAVQSLKKLVEVGYRFIIVSNQAGIARGFFSEEDLEPVKKYFKDVFRKNGLPLLDFYHCPHHPEGSVEQYKKFCHCRKPSAGLLIQAQKKYDIDLSQSWFIGDILDDIECGRRAGCRTILIDRGHETEWKPGPLRKPHEIVDSLNEAADHILNSVHYELGRK